LKQSSATWLNSRPAGQRADPPLSAVSRIGRGFTHDLTGKLICPIEFDWDNRMTREAIRSKNLNVSNSFFIRAFYRNEEGNPLDIEHGFLRSTLLIQTWRQCFLSNGEIEGELGAGSSDDNNDSAPAPTPAHKRAKNSTKLFIAAILDLKTVPPRSIAYVCVMLRFALSPVTTWGSDGTFNYEGLYNTIVDYFEQVKPGSRGDKHVKELLSWWTT
ncbi:hypothetical protein BDP27DRAFT_1230969, partial [Rhodocollybia butyracea]